MAIKTVIFTSAGADQQMALVASEAAIASNLTHSSVVATYSHDIVDMVKAVGPEPGVYKFYLVQVCDSILPICFGAVIFIFISNFLGVVVCFCVALFIET